MFQDESVLVLELYHPIFENAVGTHNLVKKSLDAEDSDYNPDNDDTETYNSNEYKNYNHNLDLDVVGVHPNNPINNHTEDEEKVDENIEHEK